MITYSYYPGLGTNSILLAGLVVCLYRLTLSALTKVYAYSHTIAAECLVEALGRAGGLIMYRNPCNEAGTRHISRASPHSRLLWSGRHLLDCLEFG